MFYHVLPNVIPAKNGLVTLFTMKCQDLDHRKVLHFDSTLLMSTVFAWHRAVKAVSSVAVDFLLNKLVIIQD